MTILPELERMLVMQAARRAGTIATPAPIAPRAAPRAAWRLRAPRRSGLLALLGAVIVAGAAASPAWVPLLGSSHTGHPTVTLNAPPAQELRLLGVLRRPQDAADRGAQTQAMLRVVGSQLHGVRTAYIRNLEPNLAGGAAILVPAERFADERGAGPFLGVREAPVCIYYPLPGSSHTERGASLSCFTAAKIEAARAVTRTHAGRGLRLSGLAPDGVASVRLVLADGSVHVGHVHENFFDVAVPVRAGALRSIQWLNAGGNPIGGR